MRVFVKNLYKFIFLQAIYSKVFKLKLSEYLDQSDEARRFIKTIIGLALMPHWEIESVYYANKNLLSIKTKNILNPFFDYYESFWLKQVKPINFSVFGMKLRTTNPIESYHAQLLALFGEHPNPEEFMCT